MFLGKNKVENAKKTPCKSIFANSKPIQMKRNEPQKLII